MKIRAAALVGLGVLLGCHGPAAPAHRLEIRTATNSTVMYVPADGQMLYCLIFTRSEKGIIRQMTMPRSNMSVVCKAGEPVMNVRFKLPTDEGKIETIVFFSDQRLNAASISEQLLDLPAGSHVRGMDLRAPGSVVVDTIEYMPEPELQAVTGEVLEEDGGVLAAGMLDAGFRPQDAGVPAAVHHRHRNADGGEPEPAAAQAAQEDGGHPEHVRHHRKAAADAGL